MHCRSCGADVLPTARFCSNCGASQASSEEERRVVTALFADIVGFTALSERRDPEQVKRLVDRAFTLLTADITAFGGVVDKIVGDQIVALFGAPVAHSDDAERAVRAGLRMQATIEQLASDLEPAVQLRIGINTGEVLVGPTTAGGDYTAMGDVMNSASRLQDLADPGQVLVGEATRDATDDAVHYRPVGSLPARGRERPIETWLAVEATRPPGVHRRKAEVFVGREAELAFLESQAALAVELRTAQLAVVVGEAGMGKSRLVDESVAALANRFDVLALKGRCVAYGEANVWWPIGEVLRKLYDLDPDLDPQATEVALRQALKQRFGEDDPEVARWMVALRHALGHETPLRGGDRNRNRAEVSLAVAQVLSHELERRPVAIVLTDMHWAAEAVWVLLDHLLGELARCPFFVMLSAETLDRPGIVSGRHGTSVLRLGPLDGEASERLLRAIGADLPQRDVEALVQRSGGNPFFLEELAGLVLAGDATVPSGTGDDGGVRAGGDQGRVADDIDRLPGTLRGIVAARLDSLEPDQRALLEDASVLGRTGSLAGLASLVREVRGVEHIDEPLADLVDLDLLVVSGSRYEFRSDLVRDVAYGTLTKTVRARRHVGIAHHLESILTERPRNSTIVAIAEHYRSAAQLIDELTLVPGINRDLVVDRALHWLGRAADRAVEVGEPAQAVRWYDHGVELATSVGADTQVLADFLFGRAQARCEVHELAGARTDLDRLEPLLHGDPVMAARALVIRGDIDRKAGDLDRAAGELREAADRLAALSVPNHQAHALRLLGITEMDRSLDSLAHQALDGSRQVAARAGDSRAEAWALQSLAWHAFVRGDVVSAEDLVNQATDIFAELGDRGGLAWTRGLQAWVSFNLGQWDRARELVASVLPETRRRGDPWSESIMLNLSASLALWSGQARQAQELAREAQEVAERADVHSVVIQSMALEGRAMVSLGRIDEGTSLLEKAFLTAERLGDLNARRLAVISNCASAARLGEPERAIRWAARFDEIHENRAAVGETDLVVSVALALLQRGAVAEAASQLHWTGEVVSETGGRYEQAVAAVLAVIEGRYDDAERAVRDVLDGPSTYLDRTLALAARAAGRYRRGDRVGTDEALAAARAELRATDDQTSRLLLGLVAAVCGQGEVDEAQQRLRGAGLDPTGWWTVWALATARRPADR
jgi:class 3 adenylate cyclase/tetratricopeptide (TPR) repeat protein